MSVAIAFVFGIIVQWISRIVFTFNYKKHVKYSVAIFGGIAFTALSYFIFLKGVGKSAYIPEEARLWIEENTRMLLLATFVVSTIVMEVLHLLRINVFKFVVLMGTFALAMAFAGNDLVNFIGVPLAGLDSFNDYMANANGASPSTYLMTSLMESAKTPPFYLFIAGIIMIIAMATSKKAQNVIKTSVDLARQDEGDEMFAVFRVTGVLSVIGGWFITAGVAFGACALVCLCMFYGGILVKVLFMALVIFLLIRSNRQYKKKEQEGDKENVFRLMMRTRDPEIVWDLLSKHVSRTQSYVTKFAMQQFNNIIDGMEAEKPSVLRRSDRELRNEKEELKKYRRQELLALRKVPTSIAIERNTWFHLGINSSEQFLYCLRRMLEPVKEHVDNSFNPLPQLYIDEFKPIRQRINDLMKQTDSMISTRRFDNYRNVLAEADECKDELSVVRKRHIDRIQEEKDNKMLQVSLVYLNILQESQQLLSNMRHQLRAAKKFIEN